MAAAVAAAMGALRSGRTSDADWLWLIQPIRQEFPLDLYPDLTDDTLARFARQEAGREREFYRRMEDRLRRKIPAALASADPVGGIDSVLRLERTFLEAHEQAAATRVHAAIRRDRVKQLSPLGAFWRMSPHVKEHTPDCIAMAMVGWWPWSVLDRIHPPAHAGCRCELLTFDEAVDLGLMANRIPDTTGADAKAKTIIAAYGLLQEAYWLQTDDSEALQAAVAQFAEAAPRVLGDVTAQSHKGSPESPQNRAPLAPAAGGPDPEIAVLREARDESKNVDDAPPRTGVMVALYPDRGLQDDLALRGGEDPGEIHLTLAFLGKTDALENEDLAVQTVRRWAERTPVLRGEVSGYGYFTGNPDGKGGKVTYASVDLPELPHSRERLCDDLCRSGHGPKTDHGFTPHMTLDYASRRPKLDRPIPITFSKVTLAWGDRHYTFPLTGQPLGRQIMEGLVDHAKTELERAGLFDKDSDYDGMLGQEILKIVKTFSEGGHSGGSAAMTIGALEKLLRFQPLTPLTSDPSEWMEVLPEKLDRKYNPNGLWQNRRNPAAFSEDGGKTWTIMEAREALPLTPLDLEEIQWDRRYAEGTVWGGRFMPRRGGFAPRVNLQDVLRRLLGPNAPRIALRGQPRPELSTGMASPGKVPDDVPAPRRPGVPPREFGEAAQEIAGIMKGVAGEAGADFNLQGITATEARFDTEGFRDWDGNVEIGAEGAMALSRYADMTRKGQHVDDDTAAGVYHTLRTTFHEATHSANPIQEHEYLDGAGFTLEEALTEEMAHQLTMDYLQANGGHDTLRWFARKPHDWRARGMYLPQRAALAAVLDQAEVPVAERRELLHRLSFAANTRQRIDILGGLVAKAKGINPEVAKLKIRQTLENVSGLDPLGDGAEVLRARNPVDRRMRIHTGATVRVGGRYEGRVSDAGWDSEGNWMIEVETKGRKGDTVWRYPEPGEIEVVKDQPRRHLKGAKVKGRVQEDQAVVVRQANGKTEEMYLARVEDEDALGWKAEAVDRQGNTVLLRPGAIEEITASKDEPDADLGDPDSQAQAGDTPETEGDAPEGGKGPPAAPETPQDTPTKAQPPAKATSAVLHDVHGPRAYDARTYQDPRRSLITKVRALPKGEKLELADGTEMVRGKHGDSVLVKRPDGTQRRYATAHRMANAEMQGIAHRLGIDWDDDAKKRRFDDEVALAGMKSPGQMPQSPERGPVAQEVLGDYADTQAKHTVLVEGVGRVYTPERRALHREIIASFIEGHTPPPPEERRVLFTAGAPGSGKSTILKTDGVEIPEDAVEVNPDLVKERLPEFQAMAAARDPYSGAGVHEESSALAREIRGIARERGLNIIVDGVGNSVGGKFERKMREMHESGYHVEVVVAHLPLTEGEKRIKARAERSGRTVPDYIIQKHYATVPKRFTEYSHDDFLDVRLYSTDVPRGEPAKLIARKPEGSNELEVQREADLNDFRALGKLWPYDGPEDVGGLPSGLRRLSRQGATSGPGRPLAGAAAGGGSGDAGQASPGWVGTADAVPEDLTALSGDDLDHLDAEVLGGEAQELITAERRRRLALGRESLRALKAHPPEVLATAKTGDLKEAHRQALSYYLQDLREHLGAALDQPGTVEPESPVAREVRNAAKVAKAGMFSPGRPTWGDRIAVKDPGGGHAWVGNVVGEVEDGFVPVEPEDAGAANAAGVEPGAVLDMNLDSPNVVVLKKGGMASPGFPKLKLFDTKKPRAKEPEVQRSKLEAPPKPVQGIPDYGDVKLKDVKAAGGSNGARFQDDPEGRRWLVKTYRGNRDRVATELLANAIYRELGVTVPNAGTTTVKVPKFGDTGALTYPLVDGELRRWSKPSEDLAEGFVADALVANWDVVGLAYDNVLWNGDTPVRLDQGGTLEYRAMGSPKPFGPVPTELWTMNKPGGQAYRRMKITDDTLKAQARDVELRLTPERVDALVDAAPFDDEQMRERVRENLKERVAWLGRYSRGQEGMPEPLDGPDTRASFEARDEELETLPDEDAALAHYWTPEGREAVDTHLRSGKPKGAASKEVQTTVATIDALLGDKVTQSPDEWRGYIELPGLDALGADTIDKLEDRWFTEKSFLRLDTAFADTPGTVVVRITVPENFPAIMPGALPSLEADDSTALLGRNLGIQIVGGEVTENGVAVLDATVSRR